MRPPAPFGIEQLREADNVFRQASEHLPGLVGADLLDTAVPVYIPEVVEAPVLRHVEGLQGAISVASHKLGRRSTGGHPVRPEHLLMLEPLS